MKYFSLITFVSAAVTNPGPTLPVATDTKGTGFGWQTASNIDSLPKAVSTMFGNDYVTNTTPLDYSAYTGSEVNYGLYGCFMGGGVAAVTQTLVISGDVKYVVNNTVVTGTRSFYETKAAKVGMPVINNTNYFKLDTATLGNNGTDWGLGRDAAGKAVYECGITNLTGSVLTAAGGTAWVDGTSKFVANANNAGLLSVF